MSNAEYSENVDHEFVPNNTETIHWLSARHNRIRDQKTRRKKNSMDNSTLSLFVIIAWLVAGLGSFDSQKKNLVLDTIWYGGQNFAKPKEELNG